MPTLVSQADFARHRGVSRKSVTVWKQQGYLVFGDGGKVDRDASDALLDARGTPGNGTADSGNEDPASADGNAPPPASGETADDLAARLDANGTLTTRQAEQVKENYLARWRKLQYEREAGQLVPIDDVEREHADRCQRIRSQLLALPNELATTLAQQLGGKPGDVRGIIQEKVNHVLEELAHARGGSS